MPATPPPGPSPAEIAALDAQRQLIWWGTVGAGAFVGYELIGGMEGAAVGGTAAYIGLLLLARGLTVDL